MEGLNVQQEPHSKIEYYVPPKTVNISLNGKVIGSLPNGLAYLLPKIEKSKAILLLYCIKNVCKYANGIIKDFKKSFTIGLLITVHSNKSSSLKKFNLYMIRYIIYDKTLLVVYFQIPCIAFIISIDW